MKKENKKQVEKILMGLFPESLLCYFGPHPPFLFSSRTGNTTLIPRHVITNIHVLPIRTDMRMPSSSQRHHHPHNTTNVSQHGTRATDLHKAARSGSLSGAQEAVNGNKELLRRQNTQGNLPLHSAVKRGHRMVALYLVGEYPQGSYVLNEERSSPLYLAVVGGHSDLVDFMFQKLSPDLDLVSKLKQGKPVVHAAIETHNQEMLQTIVKYQPELIKMHDGEGRTPLSFAAYKGNVDIVEYLLNVFPKSPSTRDEDPSRSYAIHKATVRGHIEVLKVFHSCSPKSLLSEDRFGRTILHVAAKECGNNLKDVVSYLVSLPRSISKELLRMKDETRSTPLDLALSCDNQQIVEILRGCNIA